MSKKCVSCGSELEDDDLFCENCGAKQEIIEEPKNPKEVTPTTKKPKSKVAAALLALFLGGFGIHDFYLGHVFWGIVKLILTCCTGFVGSLWAFVDFIRILIGSIKTDAKGNPLI